MSPEKTEILMNLLPILTRVDDPRSAFALFHFEVQDGWFEILKEALVKIESLAKDCEEPPCLHQVKEKFGSIRIYLSCETEEMSKIIEETEIKSEKTCEFCGQPGRIIAPRFWLKCLCRKCEYEISKES